MDKIKTLLSEVFNRNLLQAVISNPRVKDGIVKVKVRPVEIRGELLFQFEAFTKTQAFHENLAQGAAAEKAFKYMNEFRQMNISVNDADINILVSKKGKVTIQKKKKKDVVQQKVLSHNRSKKYILEEGIAVPFLQDLGVMTQDGKVVRTKFDKFRQINRFLEFIEDILPCLAKDREVTILDFGCGKSYLTFAMYYYLHELKNYDIRIIGLDLKKDVIKNCRQLAKKYGYEKLVFMEGDIADYEGVNAVDMVVTLHACDTATDFALAKAVGWNAAVILSVPCCQHELNKQIDNDILAPIMDFGLLKERFAALLTDGLRAKYLENVGYDTQVLEFIDMEHTPKNILIRAVKKRGSSKITGRFNAGKKTEDLGEQIRICQEFFHAKPTLGGLLNESEEN
ncbi:MAG: SAM-dependent methyltransferase [Schaedlerella sp.]|nr:SAM-dependent methyltransferase [Schaedlerella sp.]